VIAEHGGFAPGGRRITGRGRRVVHVFSQAGPADGRVMTLDDYVPHSGQGPWTRRKYRCRNRVAQRTLPRLPQGRLQRAGRDPRKKTSPDLLMGGPTLISAGTSATTCCDLANYRGAAGKGRGFSRLPRRGQTCRFSARGGFSGMRVWLDPNKPGRRTALTANGPWLRRDPRRQKRAGCRQEFSARRPWTTGKKRISIG